MEQRYALIENNSGYVWWVGVATSPEAACHAADIETGSRDINYEATYTLASHESGYYVYSAPIGYDCYDGQDQDECDVVSAFPFVGTFRPVLGD